MHPPLHLLFALSTLLAGPSSPEQPARSPALSLAPPPAWFCLARGEFFPIGPPLAPPDRRPGGSGCLVDVTFPYAMVGSLTGAAVISLSIDVAGPCGAPPGTYDERWIANGTFDGTRCGQPVMATFKYFARVEAGGDVHGWIWFTGGLYGLLHVSGNFADGQLSYKGFLF